jgi:hypothetical protein
MKYKHHFRLGFILCFCFVQFKLLGQNSGDTSNTNVTILLLYKAKLLKPKQGIYGLDKRRAAVIYGTSAIMWSAAVVGLNELWYKNYPRSKFQFYNDLGEWQNVDKVGHAMTGYFESRWAYCMGNWAGEPSKKAAWIGAGLGFGYQLSLEMLDAHSAKWGFSMADIAANTVGCGVFLSQQLVWGEQRVRLKFSIAQPNYPNDIEVQNRVKNLYGSAFMERTMKDYNAQVYWLSANVASFMKQKNNFPKWLNIAVGYSAEGMLGGYSNQWEANQQLVKRNDIKRYKQFILSPDVDLTRIKTKSYLLKTIFEAASIFKFPAPALVLDSNGKLALKPFFFFNWDRAF